MTNEKRAIYLALPQDSEVKVKGVSTAKYIASLPTVFTEDHVDTSIHGEELLKELEARGNKVIKIPGGGTRYIIEYSRNDRLYSDATRYAENPESVEISIFTKAGCLDYYLYTYSTEGANDV